METQRIQKISALNTENQRLENVALGDRCNRLSAMLEAESKLRKASEEKAARSDCADEELHKLRREAADLRTTLEQQNSALAALSKSEDTAQKNSRDHQKMREMLELDKKHLEKEVRDTQHLLQEQEKIAESHRSQCLSLEVKVAQLTDQLLTLQLTARSGFDERMEREMQRLR